MKNKINNDEGLASEIEGDSHKAEEIDNVGLSKVKLQTSEQTASDDNGADKPEGEPTQKRHQGKDLLDSLVIAFVIAMVIRTFLLSAYKIPSGSMISTLLIGDNLIASKISYRIGKPKFGDISVFEYPVNPKVDYIKRVIGVPGDEIEIINKQIYRNGVKLDEKYARFETTSSYRADYVNKFIVPAGHYFMLGDNRDASADSRYWGFVPESAFKAKALFIYWSKEPDGGFKGVRVNRLLKRIK